MTGWRRDLFRKRKIPCGLNTFSRAFKSCNIVRAGLLTLIIASQSAILFTVARPRGILTRFPILPAFTRDTRTHLKELGTYRFLLFARTLTRGASRSQNDRLEDRFSMKSGTGIAPVNHAQDARATIKLNQYLGATQFDLRVSLMVLKRAKEN